MIAHMLAGDRALAVVIPPARPVTLVHVVPCRCQVPAPGLAPGAPNTQTLAGPNAVTPVSSCGSGVSANCLATAHFVPFQCSTYPPRLLTAQMSALPGALTAAISFVRPLGSVACFQAVPFQCSASGAPAVAPLRSVPPNAQAFFLAGATTASRPL